MCTAQRNEIFASITSSKRLQAQKHVVGLNKTPRRQEEGVRETLNLSLTDFSERGSLSLSLTVAQQQGVFHLERPQFSTAAAACQDVVQGWLKVGDSVLSDGLEKILLMNRRPGLYACRAGQHQRQGEAEELFSVALH